MRKTFFFLMIMASYLIGNPPEPVEQKLSSDEASYDGSSLILEGNVLLEHALGVMRAKHAFLQKQDEGKDLPFSLIHLQNEVLLSLHNKSNLSCDEAKLNFNDLTGHLSSSGEGSVSYQDLLERENHPAIALHVMSKEIDLSFIKKPSDQTFLYAVSSLKAQKNVRIKYSEAFLVEAEEAFYEDKDSRYVRIYPVNNGQKCHIWYQGEHIEADTIDINVSANQLTIKEPIGALPSGLLSSQQKKPISFHSHHLLWDEGRGLLILEGDVEVEEQDFGLLQAKNTIEAKQEKHEGRTEITSFAAHGESHIQRINPISGKKHTLSCFDFLHINALTETIQLYSPKEKGPQLCYQDEEVLLYADKGKYQYGEETPESPRVLTVEGMVSFEAKKGTGTKRGIADKVTYFPGTHTLVLAALPKKKVLFQDEEQNLLMSAQEVHLTKDPTTHKTEVKGVGNVKFSLQEEELNTLRKRFAALQGTEKQ